MTVEAIPAWDPEPCAALDRFSGLQNNMFRCSANRCIHAGELERCSCGLKMAARH